MNDRLEIVGDILDDVEKMKQLELEMQLYFFFVDEVQDIAHDSSLQNLEEDEAEKLF